jgi:hypothetical protein
MYPALSWPTSTDIEEPPMYTCPECGAASIPVLAQLAPPWDGYTHCPACSATLRIKHKASNYLVVVYMLARACMPYVFSTPGASLGAFDLPMIVLLGILQVSKVEYESTPRKSRS